MDLLHLILQVEEERGGPGRVLSGESTVGGHNFKTKKNSFFFLSFYYVYIVWYQIYLVLVL
jgi:hypothetical protein